MGVGVGAAEAALGGELGGGEGRLGAIGVGVALVGRDVRHVRLFVYSPCFGFSSSSFSSFTNFKVPAVSNTIFIFPGKKYIK